MPDLGATSHVRLRADRGGRLVWGPHTTILHAESDYASVIEVELAGGVVIVAETVAMGRLASGEAFAFRRYDSGLTVRDEAGTVLFAERASLAPSTTLRDAMGGRGALTTVYALGMQPDAWTAERLTDVTSGARSRRLVGFAEWRRHCREGLDGERVARGGVCARVHTCDGLIRPRPETL